MNKSNEDGYPVGEWRHEYEDSYVISSSGHYAPDGCFIGRWVHELRDGHRLEMHYPEAGMAASVYRHIAPDGTTHEWDIPMFSTEPGDQ